MRSTTAPLTSDAIAVARCNCPSSDMGSLRTPATKSACLRPAPGRNESGADLEDVTPHGFLLEPLHVVVGDLDHLRFRRGIGNVNELDDPPRLLHDGPVVQPPLSLGPVHGEALRESWRHHVADEVRPG